MVLSAEEIAEQAGTMTPGDGQNSKAEVEHVDRTTASDVPPMAGSGRQRHLA